MSTESAPRGMQAAPSAPPLPLAPTLDDLARLSPRELDALYAAARTPAVEDLDGALAGRMLAVPPLGTAPLVPTLLQRWAASRAFVWQGKTFKARDEGKGEGVNRVLGDRYSWFRFATFVGPSRAGDFEAVHLDYDNPGNPPLIRAVKDEVREVAPGLWLGLAYLKRQEQLHLACYFGLAKPEQAEETRVPAASRGMSSWTMLAMAASLVAVAAWLLWPRQRDEG